MMVAVQREKHGQILGGGDNGLNNEKYKSDELKNSQQREDCAII